MAYHDTELSFKRTLDEWADHKLTNTMSIQSFTMTKSVKGNVIAVGTK